jgi:transposase-like protein
MEIFETVACPFCGQLNEVTVDISLSRQRFTTDCEVCCRPFEVITECEGGEILNLETTAN